MKDQCSHDHALHTPSAHHTAVHTRLCDDLRVRGYSTRLQRCRVRKGLGNEPFSIGLWVGDKSTPNTRKSAFNSKTDDSKSTPEQLLVCPCCRKPLRYHQPLPTDAVQVFCRSVDCALAGDLPLPVWTVDEDVYAARPTLLVGTVDKFAQIVRRRRQRSCSAWAPELNRS